MWIINTPPSPNYPSLMPRFGPSRGWPALGWSWHWPSPPRVPKGSTDTFLRSNSCSGCDPLRHSVGRAQNLENHSPVFLASIEIWRVHGKSQQKIRGLRHPSKFHPGFHKLAFDAEKHQLVDLLKPATLLPTPISLKLPSEDLIPCCWNKDKHF